MDVKEAIKAIGEKIEKNSDYYAKTLKKDTIVKIEEVVKDCVVTVWIEKREK